MSPRSRRTRVMLQIGHLLGQSDTTPGSIRQKNSVEDETVSAALGAPSSRSTSRQDLVEMASHGQGHGQQGQESQADGQGAGGPQPASPPVARRPIPGGAVAVETHGESPGPAGPVAPGSPGAADSMGCSQCMSRSMSSFRITQIGSAPATT